MAKILWLFVVACSVLVSTASAKLQCLKCNDCENEPSRSSSCLPGFDVCAKMHLGGKVRKFCAPELACHLKDIKRSSINPLENLKTLFSDDDVKELNDGKKQAIYCCDSDFCNGSTEKRATLGLLILPFLLYLLGC